MVGVEWSDRWAESRAALWPSKARPLSGPAVPAEGDGSLLTPPLKPGPLACWDCSPCFLLKVLSLPALEAGAHHSLRPPGGRSALRCREAASPPPGWPRPLPGVVFSQERNFYLSYLYLYACGRAEGWRRCSCCPPYLTPLTRTGPTSSHFSGVAGLGRCHQVGRDPPAPCSYRAHLPTGETLQPSSLQAGGGEQEQVPAQGEEGRGVHRWAYSSFIDALDTIKPQLLLSKRVPPLPPFSFPHWKCPCTRRGWTLWAAEGRFGPGAHDTDFDSLGVLSERAAG